MIDTHCHLDVPAFDGDRAQVIARARAAGVSHIIVPAIRPRTWDALLGICGEGIVPALGIHPQIVPDLAADERTVDGMAAAITRAGACAVGECGLDGGTGDHAEQERLFAAQIAVARELKLPLLVHVLRAHDAAPRILKAARAHEVGGIMHSYSGSPELVKVYADLGFAFSFAGPVTYNRAKKPVAAARAVPEALLCAETDAPDQPPAARAGQRSEPAFVADVIAGLAAARDVQVAEMIALTTANARRILRLH